ncbi:hypothetical protein ACIA8I_04230 [Streptomyces rishiriensis]
MSAASVEQPYHQFYVPGQSFTLPYSIGAEVTLSAAEILAAGRPRTSG